MQRRSRRSSTAATGSSTTTTPAAAAAAAASASASASAAASAAASASASASLCAELEAAEQIGQLEHAPPQVHTQLDDIHDDRKDATGFDKYQHFDSDGEVQQCDDDLVFGSDHQQHRLQSADCEFNVIEEFAEIKDDQRTCELKWEDVRIGSYQLMSEDEVLSPLLLPGLQGTARQAVGRINSALNRAEDDSSPLPFDDLMRCVFPSALVTPLVDYVNKELAAQHINISYQNSDFVDFLQAFVTLARMPRVSISDAYAESTATSINAFCTQDKFRHFAKCLRLFPKQPVQCGTAAQNSTDRAESTCLPTVNEMYDTFNANRTKLFSAPGPNTSVFAMEDDLVPVAVTVAGVSAQFKSIVLTSVNECKKRTTGVSVNRISDLLHFVVASRPQVNKGHGVSNPRLHSIKELLALVLGRDTHTSSGSNIIACAQAYARLPVAAALSSQGMRLISIVSKDKHGFPFSLDDDDDDGGGGPEHVQIQRTQLNDDTFLYATAYRRNKQCAYHFDSLVAPEMRNVFTYKPKTPTHEHLYNDQVAANAKALALDPYAQLSELDNCNNSEVKTLDADDENSRRRRRRRVDSVAPQLCRWLDQNCFPLTVGRWSKDWFGCSAFRYTNTSVHMILSGQHRTAEQLPKNLIQSWFLNQKLKSQAIRVGHINQCIATSRFVTNMQLLGPSGLGFQLHGDVFQAGLVAHKTLHYIATSVDGLVLIKVDGQWRLAALEINTQIADIPVQSQARQRISIDFRTCAYDSREFRERVESTYRLQVLHHAATLGISHVFYVESSASDINNVTLVHVAPYHRQAHIQAIQAKGFKFIEAFFTSAGTERRTPLWPTFANVFGGDIRDNPELRHDALLAVSLHSLRCTRGAALPGMKQIRYISNMLWHALSAREDMFSQVVDGIGAHWCVQLDTNLIIRELFCNLYNAWRMRQLFAAYETVRQTDSYISASHALQTAHSNSFMRFLFELTNSTTIRYLHGPVPPKDLQLQQCNPLHTPTRCSPPSGRQRYPPKVNGVDRITWANQPWGRSIRLGRSANYCDRINNRLHSSQLCQHTGGKQQRRHKPHPCALCRREVTSFCPGCSVLADGVVVPPNQFPPFPSDYTQYSSHVYLCNIVRRADTGMTCASRWHSLHTLHTDPAEHADDKNFYRNKKAKAAKRYQKRLAQAAAAAGGTTTAVTLPEPDSMQT
jgi:hypothetical protein